MPIRKIIAPVRGDGNGRYVLAHAVSLAKRFNSHVDVAYIKTGRETPWPFGMPLSNSMKGSILEAMKHREIAEIEGVRAHYDEICTADNILQSDAVITPRDRMTISWSTYVGRQSRMLAKLGRTSDLIVIARPDPVNRVGINTLEESLFNTGKPVLIVPKKAAPELGQHIAVAWNDSAAASRALTLSLPLITAADQVSVLTASTSGRSRENTAALVEYLKRHDVEAGVRLFDCNSAELGVGLMAEAKNLGADMLVLGAYGHNRHKEILMGGVTEHIIWNMEMPIIMAR